MAQGRGAAGRAPSLPPSLSSYEIGGDTGDGETGGGSLGVGLLVAGFAAFAVAVVVFAIGAGGVAAIVMSQQAGPAPPHAPAPDPDPTPPAPAPPAAGGEITQPDSRSNVPTATTVLAYQGPAGARVTIKGAGGFAATWDGAAPFELGAVGDGRYSTMVELPDGKKLRGKAFRVDGRKNSCSFTFDAGQEDWAGGCQ